ncbi:MAG: hypothetical protein IKT39_04735 [Clostridia bacterium]|nr:hypothetical protein [Clostridia bacterium]
MKLRDKFWMWGHPEGIFNDRWGNNRPSRMTPMEACLYLGVKNNYMIALDWDVNIRQYNKSFTTLNEVGWECYKACDDPAALEPIIKEAADFPNVKRIVFDDFVRLNGKQPIDMNNLPKIRDRLKNNEVRPMDMWMVVYTHDIGITTEGDDFHKEVLKSFDGAIMWNWEEKNIPQIPEKWEIFKRLTEGKKRQFGCYLWDFGTEKEATAEGVIWQLDWAREKILAGECEGVVFLTNTLADLDLVAFDAAIEWMNKHGDEEI